MVTYTSSQLPPAPRLHRPPSAPSAASVPSHLSPPPDPTIPSLHLPPLHIPPPPLPPPNAPAVVRVPDAPVPNTLPPLTISGSSPQPSVTLPLPTPAPSSTALQDARQPPSATGRQSACAPPSSSALQLLRAQTPTATALECVVPQPATRAAVQSAREQSASNSGAVTLRQQSQASPRAAKSSKPNRIPVAKEVEFKAKRSSKSISHAEKRRLCELHDENPRAKHGHIARMFHAETGHRIERSTVSRVLQRKDYWKGKGVEDANRKRLASPRFPTVEEALSELIRHRSIWKAQGDKLNDKELMTLSKDIANTLCSEFGSVDKNSPNYTPLLESFRGSLSWIGMFRKRNGLLSAIEAKAIEGKSHCSASGNGETPDIWDTPNDVAETKNLLSNWTRLEDVYFLEASVLATNALPQHATDALPGHQQEKTTPNDCNRYGSPNGAGGTVGGPSANGDLLSPINFVMPPMPTSITGPTTALVAMGAANNQHNSGLNGENGGVSSGVDDTSNDSGSANNNSHQMTQKLDDDSVVVVLLGANATASDRRTPWVIGKKPLRKVGTIEGEVWHDCDVRYFNNARGWLTGRVLKEWVKEFDASLDANRHVALVTSLLSTADTEVMELSNVTVISLPRMERTRDSILSLQWRANSSPMNHGIEEVFRSKYRGLVVEKSIECVSKGSSLKPLSLRVASGLIKEAWDKIPIPLLRRAWRDLSYLPGRLLRAGNQQRGNAKNITEQRREELIRIIRAYQKALANSSRQPGYGISTADLHLAIHDPSKYVWLAAEPSVFHPQGKVIDYVQSVCSQDFPKEPTSEDEMEISPFTKGSLSISTHEDALNAANSLAEFMRKDDALKGGQSLYLIGSLQLELKGVLDRTRDLAQKRSWSR